ncbi:hypothetical protein KUCAC02_000254 [Chaenocephalus aceratus]|uniref:Uncharacterized protein n=1 Tax=Chaenocephalus aceratus TaxID=36190 RepID=A0ACB9W5X8_CHAAC|nr:hypothetical protein KUCAC02_000254 [Chaenocephalus aceratus]
MEEIDTLFTSTFLDTLSQEMESLGVVNQSEGNALMRSSLEMGRSTDTLSLTLNPIGSPFGSSSAVNIDVPLGGVQLTTIDVSDLRSQLGIGLGVWNINPQPQSHQNPLSDTASPNSSLQNDETDDCLTVESPVSSTVSPEYSPWTHPFPSPRSLPPYLASLQFLGEEQKQVYKRKNEAAKKDYLKVPTEVTASSPPTASSTFIATSASNHIEQTTRPQQYHPEENTITNICTSNIILDVPQVTTRSRTGAIKPQPPPFSAPLPNHPTITKIIIKQMKLPSGVVWMTGASPCQPPPHRILKINPLKSKVQQMMLVQAPPSLQAEPHVSTSTILTPLQIKVVPMSKEAVLETSASESPTLGSTVQVGQLAGEEAEDGMEVQVNVAPVQSVTPIASCNVCVRSGCTNPAVESNDWDYEYCSNECVATHCSDEFMAWCAIRGPNSTTVT